MGFRFPIFDTYEDFVSALKSARVITLTKEHDRRVMNRSHTSSIDGLKSLVSGYNMPRDVDRIVQGYNTNAAMPYPIILKGSKGEWIMAGNTRLDTAFIMGVVPKVLYVDVSDNKVTESEEHQGLSLSDLRDLHDELEDEIDRVSSASMRYDAEDKEYKALERDTQALSAISAVVENNIRAIKKGLLQNNIFLYDNAGIDTIAAIHVQIQGDVAEIKWLGSYGTHAKPLYKEALAIAKARGAKRVAVDAKWQSAGFYRKMGLDQGETSEYNPFSDSSITKFSGNL